MKKINTEKPKMMDRRQTLAFLGGAGASLFLAGGAGDVPADAQTSLACVLAPQMTEGPYWVDEKLNRSDIRVDPSDSSTKPGVLLTLSITVHAVNGSSCGLLPGAYVDIWHCDAGGLYSDEAANNTVGKKFLRGYQITDDNGVVKFTTIYPGWYMGRTVHIHVRVRTYSGSQVLGQFTSQFFFDDSITDQVLAQSPYNTRGTRETRNSNDMVLRDANNSNLTMLALTKTDQGYSASVDIGVNLTSAVAKAAINTGGVVNAASFQSGVVPQGWISIFGRNLAASTRTVASSDLVNGNLPTNLGGVSVQVNNKAAFMHHISPTQINVQAPADTSAGAVQVTVTNANGTSDPLSATMQSILPGFFASQNYIAAVRSDGIIITGVASSASGTAQATKPGDVLQLYGTGFGPTNPSVAPGLVFQGSYPLSSPVTITIGGVAVTVSYAGLVAAGLYQFNVTVPNLANGDHVVVAEIAGLRTQSGVFLKVQS